MVRYEKPIEPRTENNTHKLLSDGNRGFIEPLLENSEINSYKVNNRFYDCAKKNTQLSENSHLSTCSSSPPTDASTPLIIDLLSPHSALVHMQQERNEGFSFTCDSKMCCLNGCQCDCIPADLIIKGESHSEWEKWKRVEERNGWAGLFSAGRLSGRQWSPDVTNAVNVMACLQYGLLERAEPIAAVLPVFSPTHLKYTSTEAI